MPSTPLVSIVLPAFSDSPLLADALRACTSQTLEQIEIIVVASAPATIEADVSSDRRVRIIHAPDATSLVAAHRAGAFAALAAHVLPLSASDVLDDDAVRLAHRTGVELDADIIRILAHDDRRKAPSAVTPQRRISGGRRTLRGDDILRQVFPDSAVVDHRTWRHLFRTELLREVCESMPAASTPAPASPLPVVFLACATARTHVTLWAPLYHRVAEAGSELPGSDAGLALDEAAALSNIEGKVRELARNVPNPEPLVEGFESLRLATIARAADALADLPDDNRRRGQDQLGSSTNTVDIIAAASRFSPRALSALSRDGDHIRLGQKPVRRLLLTTNVLTTGGVSGVLRTQARMFLDAGYEVTIATHRPGTDLSAVPDGAALVQMAGSPRNRLHQWAELCRTGGIDVIIDHRILYSRDWPAYALAAREGGAATIGWIHNFAGRPTYNGNDLHTLMRDNMDALAKLVVLSPLDVAFWKLRGVGHVTYLPNPPSPLLLDSIGKITPKTAPAGRRLELVWWGRLEEHTKKVTELVSVAAELKRLGVDFRMRVIGPDWTDMTSARLSSLVSARNLDGFVEVTGPRHGQDLLDAITSSDMFVNTSIIEGYPLTLPEAQSYGLPVAMYDLPWLALTRDNKGVVAVPQGDAVALATAISDVAADPERYEAMSRAAVESAERATTHDFAQLYRQLITGALPEEYSPEPTLDDGRQLVRLLVFFAERSSSPQSIAARAARRARRRAAPPSVGRRIEGSLTEAGHRILGVAPWVRPALRKIKHGIRRL
ncbi:glycosyltransferase [Microbacterium sp. NPDC058389]|uniref:glycosyltransferase n=1 Tax=Microbacterium sp. NPDC058389 TaxID=3346475 RepID=UPI00364A32DE